MTTLERHSGAPGHARARNTIISIAGIELWERFSFYGMQAILVYYLYSQAGGLGMEKAQATAFVGVYGSALYLCTFVGGWVADRVLGVEKTLLVGAGLLMAGHLTLSLAPGYAGLVCGLGPLALGSGLLKTSAITILGAAFPARAGARDSAFQVFYLGINIGALGGPLLTGWLAQHWGYHAGFLCAAILMALGCANYGLLRARLFRVLQPETIAFITAPVNPISPLKAAGLAAALVGAVVAAITALTPQQLAYLTLAGTVVTAAILFFAMLVSPRVSRAERANVRSFLPLFACSTFYWTLQAQIYGVLAVYSAERLNRHIGSFEVPAAWTQSLNPLFILLLTGPCAVLLARMALPSRHVLMGLGIATAGAGMLLLLPFAGGGPQSTPLLVLVACIGLMSAGELLIGPIGMAACAAHAPRAYATRFSALYFLTMAIGFALAGALSPLYSADSERLYILLVGTVPIALGACLLALRSRWTDPEG